METSSEQFGALLPPPSPYSISTLYSLLSTICMKRGDRLVADGKRDSARAVERAKYSRSVSACQQERARTRRESPEGMESLPQVARKRQEAMPRLHEKLGSLPVASNRLKVCARARGRDRDCVSVCVWHNKPCYTAHLILPIPPLIPATLRTTHLRRYKMQTRVWNYRRARTSRHGTERVKRSRGRGVASSRWRPITLALHSRPPAPSFFRSAPSTCM